jgi:spore maturation protein CgeB
MLTEDIIHVAAAHELAKKLPSLEKHDYDTIDKLVRNIAKKHSLTDDALHDIFKKTYHKIPVDWIEDVKDLNETSGNPSDDLGEEVKKFAEWAGRRLNIQRLPKIELSYDTQDAQDNHHTGGHVQGQDSVWVYAKNRNLVDILRTVFHELVHIRQDEIGMIKPGDSYPGSPIEAMADLLAGKYIKIYGERNHHIFQ